MQTKGVNLLFKVPLMAVSGGSPQLGRVVNELPLDALDSLMPLTTNLQVASKAPSKWYPLFSNAAGDTTFR